MEISDTIFWVNHACFYLKANDTTIFIDPFRVSDMVREKADLILITHAHHDHNSKPDIEKIRQKGTKFIGAQKSLEGEKEVIRSKPGFKTKFKDIEIEAVPAYNNMEEKLQFHPKHENWVGYIININGFRIYHAGDTDLIPEMKSLNDIDVALLPMGGKYTMTVDEAIQAAKVINPKSVVPMHYKMLLGEMGSSELERKVKARLSNSIIMREVQDPIYSF